MKLLTPEQVGEQTQLSVDTVRRALQAGQLSGYKVGNRWRVPKDAVQDWLEGGERGASSVKDGPRGDGLSRAEILARRPSLTASRRSSVASKPSTFGRHLRAIQDIGGNP